MNQLTLDLRRIQRWMQAVITHPDGVEQGIVSAEAKGLIDVALEEVDAVVRPSRALTSLDRLMVYGNAYYARLLECLRDEFPALAHFLGEETFNGFAFGYLQAYPSSSYTLGELGKNFSRYLDETSPREDRGLDEPHWTDFLVDLATLERIYSEVFDGPGTERTEVLAQDDLIAIPANEWPSVRLIPAPCLRLLLLRFPVHEYASAVRQNRDVVVPGPRTTHLAVTRRNYIVRRLELTPVEYQLLVALTGGESVGQAISQVARFIQPGPASHANHLEAWFRRWALEGLFCGVSARS